MSMHHSNKNLSEQKRLSRIFLENEGLIKSVIFTKVSDRQQAEDIFQDFFLSFVTSPPKNHDNIKSYIRTRLNRDIIDLCRKNTRYRNLIDRYSKSYPIETASNDKPELKAIVDEEKTKMLNLLSDNLTKSEAKAVELRHIHSYSTEETSEIMKIKKRSASRYLAIAVKKLRIILQPNPLESES